MGQPDEVCADCRCEATKKRGRQALRKGEPITPLIHENIRSKAKELGGQFTADFEHLQAGDIHNRSMISIGG